MNLEPRTLAVTLDTWCNVRNTFLLAMAWEEEAVIKLSPCVKISVCLSYVEWWLTKPSLCQHGGRIFKCFENTPESHTTVINSLASAEQQAADHNAA